MADTVKKVNRGNGKVKAAAPTGEMVWARLRMLCPVDGAGGIARPHHFLPPP